MASQVKKLRSRGASPWDDEFLEASGVGRLSVLSLADEDVMRTEYLDVLRSARTPNGLYLRRRLLARNRACMNAIHPDAITGPAYQQLSCQNSMAQDDLNALATSVAEKIIRRTLNADDQRDLVARSLEQVQNIQSN